METHNAEKLTEQQESQLGELLQGREVRWYKGHYLKLNALLVCPRQCGPEVAAC